MNWLKDLRNRIDYPLRQHFAWKRPGLRFKQEDKTHLFDDLPVELQSTTTAREHELRRRYHLGNFYRASSRKQYREGLYYLDLLERALETSQLSLESDLKVADIGVSHWFYVQSLHALLSWWQTDAPRRLQLHGFESDPYRIYANLYSRFDHALAHIGELTEVHYFPHEFKPVYANYDLILMLFPFIFKCDHLKWGLPMTSFTPQDLLQQAWLSLKPGAALLIVNQGKDEYQRQQEMLQLLPAKAIASFEFESPFFSYDIPRYGTVVTHDES